MTISLAAASATSMTAPTQRAAPSLGVSRRPMSSARPSEPQIVRDTGRRADSAETETRKPVRRPRPGPRRCRLPAAVAQPIAPPGRNQVRPYLHAGRVARNRAPARGGACRFLHQGRSARDQARPRRHAFRTRASTRHQVIAGRRARRGYRALAERHFGARASCRAATSSASSCRTYAARRSTCATSFEADAFRSTDAALPMALGKSIGGEPIVADLARMPHLLVAGTTGSGKSVGINAMILSLLYRRSPEECRLLMIDPKMLELSVYNGIPHLLTPVVTDPHKAVRRSTGSWQRWRNATSAWRLFRCAILKPSMLACARRRVAASVLRAPCRPALTTAPARPSTSSRDAGRDDAVHRRRRRRVR